MSGWQGSAELRLSAVLYCVPAVCNEIDQWPPPVPGQTLNLPVMGVVIQVPAAGDGGVTVWERNVFSLGWLINPLLSLAPSL